MGHLWTVCLHCPGCPAAAVEHHGTAAAPTPAGERNAAGEGQTDTRPAPARWHPLLAPEPQQHVSCAHRHSANGTAPVTKGKGEQKSIMVRVALSHFREVKMGERVRWGESHRRKTVPAVLALVTVSKESQFKYNGHQRSSAADVVCLLNHPFIEGLLIQYPQVRPCFGLVFWGFFVVVGFSGFFLNYPVNVDPVCSTVASSLQHLAPFFPPLFPMLSSWVVTTETSNALGQGFTQAAAQQGTNLCRRPKLY